MTWSLHVTAVNTSPVVNASAANQKDKAAAASPKSQGEAGKSVTWERSSHRRKTGELCGGLETSAAKGC